MSWRQRAACVAAVAAGEVTTDDFFAEGDGIDAVERLEQARRICDACPVRTACLDDHLEERFGIFGGLDPNERKRLRRARKAAA